MAFLVDGAALSEPTVLTKIQQNERYVGTTPQLPLERCWALVKPSLRPACLTICGITSRLSNY